MMRAPRLRLRDEEGAAAVEFALVFPILAFLIFALLFALFAVAAHVSLAHAASRGARFAAIPSDPATSSYPSAEEVEAHVLANTPFFSASSCETTITEEPKTENAPIALNVVCEFPFPVAGALDALGDMLMRRTDPDVSSDNLMMSAHAEARRE